MHVILQEDIYETCFGDGRFLYPFEAFLDESSAKKRVAEKNAEKTSDVGYRYSLKTVEVERQEHQDRLVADIRLDPGERCSLEDVVRLLTTGATRP